MEGADGNAPKPEDGATENYNTGEYTCMGNDLLVDIRRRKGWWPRPLVRLSYSDGAGLFKPALWILGQVCKVAWCRFRVL